MSGEFASAESTIQELLITDAHNPNYMLLHTFLRSTDISVNLNGIDRIEDK
jgi:hypothetical protein